MGEVYLAQDEHLQRPVALKILPNAAAPDAMSAARLTQEARATATLSHPNIAHIYEVGEANGTPFLAMEYVDGDTLDKSAPGKPLPSSEVLEIGIQVADALEEAHHKGIIHRDIKPSNLIRNTRGQVKILDFGLAKLSDRRRLKLVPVLATTRGAPESTLSGHAIGSIPYMSPEQAMAKDLDGRTDIFSLGAVLYELSTGQRAFRGVTAALVFDSILNRTPPAPRTLNPYIDPALDRVIRRCLEKDPALRYQTAADLVGDLRLIQREHVVSGVTQAARQNWKLRVGIAAAALVVVAVASWYASRRNSSGEVLSLRTVPLTTFPGSESHPSFSPDGTQVVFSWNQGKEDDLDLFVKVVEAGTPLRLTNTPETEYSPAWSPDGRYIAFLRQSISAAGFFLIPALGGAERQLTVASANRVGADAPFIAWSPDSKTVALVDRENDLAPLSLYLLDVGSGQKRKLTSPPEKTIGDSMVSFSPDGRSIAFVRAASLAVMDIFTVDVQNGSVRRLTDEKRRIHGMAWNTDDGKLIFSSAREPGVRLWRLSPNGGKPERILGIGDQAGFLTLSAAKHRLAYTRSSIDTNIWRYAMPRAGAAEPEGANIMPSTRMENGPRYSPDGKSIVFTSNSAGSQEIWVAEADGGKPRQLTSFGGPATGSPMWSPDGKWIVFDSRPDSNPDIYIVNIDGSTPRRFTTDATEELMPSFSGDGKWIYFSSKRTGRFEVWKQPFEGSTESVQLTKDGGLHPIESPDGKWIYYTKGLNQAGLWRMATSGGAAEELVLKDLPAGWSSYWSFGKGGIYYILREGIPGGGARYPLHFLDQKTGRDTIVTWLARRPFSSGLSVSPDGKWFLYTQVDTSETEILLVDGFR